MGTLVYFIKEAVRGLIEAKLMTFVSILSIAMTLTFACVIVLVVTNVGAFINKLGDQADMAVYLEDSLVRNEDDLEELIAIVKKLPQVEHVKYVSKDSAVQRFSSIYGKEMLESVDQNPLPASLDIFLRQDLQTSESVKTLEKEITRLGGVESAQTAWEGISTLENFQWTFIMGAFIVFAVMILLLHSMIANTIKLTIYARKELVRNMRLVGATNFFISMPFILEGMLQGFTGGLVSVVLLTLVKISFARFIVAWDFDFLPLLTIAAGVVFGWIGSMSAVRKFLV
ncbi:MAG TPA: permease-like cell division protein FtsX [Chitinispirillaceae bacterium]|nr:permease-like cell division protein FtsX [Chitinispirillaceae bacterium]